MSEKPSSSPFHVLIILHAGADGLEGLRRYEAQVLPIMEEHGGRMLTAFKPRGHEDPSFPDEIHLLEFPTESIFRCYRDDPRVAALSEQRRTAIGETVVYVSEEAVDYVSRQG